MRNHDFLAVLTLVSVLLISNCAEKSDGELRAAGVVNGEIVTVKALALGRLTSMDFQEGDRVEKEYVLARIDSDKIANKMESLETGVREIHINRLKLRSRLDYLKSTEIYWTDQVARLERLRKAESVSGDELEKARLKLKEVQSSLNDVRHSLESLSAQLDGIAIQRKGLELQIEDTVITSPISGIVLERYVSLGETVMPGTSVADILDPDSLYVEVFLEERELSSLEIGQAVMIQADGLDRNFHGTVYYFNRKSEFSPKYIVSEKERRSLLYGMRIRMEEGQDALKVGMPVTVIIP
jgi:HlyD family secretion protein